MNHLVVFFLYFFSLSLSTSLYSITPSDQAKILQAHNNERRAWGLTNDLVWDSGLASDSAVYSTNCVFQHSSNPNRAYGENIAYSSYSDPSTFPNDMVASHITDPNYGWIGSEEPNWICKDPWAVSNVLHFTQIIWKDTTSVGCGISLCAPGTIASGFYSQFFVCRYTVAGNVEPNHPLTGTTTIPSPCTRTFSSDSPPPPPPSNPPPPPPPSNPPPPPPPSNPPPPPPPSNPPPPPPPTSSSSWSTCTANYYDSTNSVTKVLPCLAQPWQYESKWYCDCGAPDQLSWSLTNTNCLSVSQAVADSNAEQSSPALSIAAYVGIGIGVAAGVIVLVVVIVLFRNRRSSKTEEKF